MTQCKFMGKLKFFYILKPNLASFGLSRDWFNTKFMGKLKKFLHFETKSCFFWPLVLMIQYKAHEQGWEVLTFWNQILLHLAFGMNDSRFMSKVEKFLHFETKSCFLSPLVWMIQYKFMGKVKKFLHFETKSCFFWLSVWTIQYQVHGQGREADDDRVESCALQGQDCQIPQPGKIKMSYFWYWSDVISIAWPPTSTYFTKCVKQLVLYGCEF